MDTIKVSSLDYIVGKPNRAYDGRWIVLMRTRTNSRFLDRIFTLYGPHRNMRGRYQNKTPKA